MKALRKPTSKDALSVREVAKSMGFKIRVAKTNFSLRLIGKTQEVSEIAKACGLCGAAGAGLDEPFVIPDYDGQTQFFAYVPS